MKKILLLTIALLASANISATGTMQKDGNHYNQAPSTYAEYAKMEKRKMDKLTIHKMKTAIMNMKNEIDVMKTLLEQIVKALPAKSKSSIMNEYDLFLTGPTAKPMPDNRLAQ